MQAQEPTNPPVASEDSIITQHDRVPGQYDVTIRQARNTLFVIAGLQFLVGAFIAYSSRANPLVAWTSFASVTIVAAIFSGLGIYAKKKPFTAIMLGIVLYLSLLVLDALSDPSTILQGVVYKAVIIFFLARSLGDAKAAQEGMKHMKGG